MNDRSPWPDALLGLLVAAFGLWQANLPGSFDGGLTDLVIIAGMAVAAALYRLAPLTALALVWAVSTLQILADLDISYVQLATVFVSYGTARYGRAVTLWLSGLSIPIGAGIALLYVRDRGTTSLTDVGQRLAPDKTISMTTAFLLAIVLLTLPWGLGMVLRLSAQFRNARVEREQAEIEATRAQEIAELRSEQARLARDVHDVVGHSLTVILAQADSVEFMPDDDIARIRAAVSNISTSARKSLGDVRQVLSPSNDPGEAATVPTGGLDGLIDGVRSAGHEIASGVVGTARPLPPELDVVAFRVLQEMLTNALKHGPRGVTIAVERTWSAHELKIEVHNAVAEPTRDEPADSIGLPGMRRRLEAVGGRLDIRRSDGTAAGAMFTATAWVPVRSRGGV